MTTKRGRQDNSSRVTARYMAAAPKPKSSSKASYSYSTTTCIPISSFQFIEDTLAQAREHLANEEVGQADALLTALETFVRRSIEDLTK